MSRRDDLALARRTFKALHAADVVRPLPPHLVLRAVAIGRRMQATPATSIAIAAACDPSGLAVVDERGAITWAQLNRRAQAIAYALTVTYGAGRDRPVAVLCRNHRGLLEAMAAAAWAGADVLALNTEFAAPQLAAALADRDVAVVIHDEEFTERLDEARAGVRQLLAFTEAADPTPFERLARSAAKLDDAPGRRSTITILTSGTTGVPKGAARDLPARAMLGPIVTLIEHLGLRRGEPILVAPPLFHGFGLALASIAQAIGAPVVLQRSFDAAGVLTAIERHRIACLVVVPVMLQRILSLPVEQRVRNDTSSLKSVLSAGAPLAPHVSERFMDSFGDVVFNAYGSTETGFGAIAAPADLRAAPGTVGRAPLGSSLVVLDEQRRPAPVGATGHLFVGGDLVFDGYSGGGSKEVVDGRMNTGDLGHVDAAGRVFVDGREDDMIVSGGENVFPQEVEDALGSHPDVVDAAVFGVEDADFGQRLLAYVVPSPERAPTREALDAHLRGRLERYKLPRDIEFRAEIPRTPTGKVVRYALEASADNSISP